MDNNINILDEINKGCSMGLEAIDMLLKKTDEHKFRDILVSMHEDYVSLSDEIKEIYHTYIDDEIHKINMTEKMMAWMGIMKDTMIDDSVSKVAEVMINGTVMGIIEGRKILNHKTMDKKIHRIVDKYVKVQEKYLNILKDFL